LKELVNRPNVKAKMVSTRSVEYYVATAGFNWKQNMFKRCVSFMVQELT